MEIMPDQDEKRRDEILKRMLKTPPKPHKPPASDKPKDKTKKEKPAK